MKSAILIRDGRTQVVLTPETPLDEMVLGQIQNAENFKMKRGEFYACQGGWDRERGGSSRDLILVIDKGDEQEN